MACSLAIVIIPFRWWSRWCNWLDFSGSSEHDSTAFRTTWATLSWSGFPIATGGVAAKLFSDLQGKEKKHGFNRYLQPSCHPWTSRTEKEQQDDQHHAVHRRSGGPRAAHNDYVHSDQFNDVKRFSEFLAEDFIVQLPGVTRNRAEFLEHIAKPRPFKDLAVHDVNIRILGDVALIHGRSTYTMLADGVEQEALYTDMYRKREGTWVCVAACAIAPGA
jgi:hypothetical protein